MQWFDKCRQRINLWIILSEKWTGQYWYSLPLHMPVKFSGFVFFSSRLPTLVIDRYYSRKFELAKSREIASGRPRSEVDTTIPGWVRLG